VRIRDIKRIRKIWSALIDQGVNRFDHVFFEVSDRRKRIDAICEKAIQSFLSGNKTMTRGFSLNSSKTGVALG
jgi:uncharacterized protein YggE